MPLHIRESSISAAQPIACVGTTCRIVRMRPPGNCRSGESGVPELNTCPYTAHRYEYDWYRDRVESSRGDYASTPIPTSCDNSGRVSLGCLPCLHQHSARTLPTAEGGGPGAATWHHNSGSGVCPVQSPCVSALPSWDLGNSHAHRAMRDYCPLSYSQTFAAIVFDNQVRRSCGFAAYLEFCPIPARMHHSEQSIARHAGRAMAHEGRAFDAKQFRKVGCNSYEQDGRHEMHVSQLSYHSERTQPVAGWFATCHDIPSNRTAVRTEYAAVETSSGIGGRREESVCAATCSRMRPNRTGSLDQDVGQTQYRSAHMPSYHQLYSRAREVSNVSYTL
jgi:hypothetical protein